MGNSYSFQKEEELTWDHHDLSFDGRIRETVLKHMFSFFPENSKIKLAYRDTKYGGLEYQHWFIADANFTHFLELSSMHEWYNDARVQVNMMPHFEYTVVKERDLTEEINERMKQMLGMKNYSLCLRNSEHVANYIFNGRWFSSQMGFGGKLLEYFEGTMPDNALKYINAFPSSISPKTVTGNYYKPLYSIIQEKYELKEFQYYLDGNEGNEATFNILVVGPTGAGKSRLINVFFNAEICESRVRYGIVTRDICFIKGYGDIIDMKTMKSNRKEIVVADTVGLCDTAWDDATILNLIKGRVSRNFKTIDAVYIVFRADRLLKEHVKNIKAVMEWLRYKEGDNCLNFLFVGTFADHLNKEEKEVLKEQAQKMLDLEPTERKGDEDQPYNSLVYVGFPPERQLNDMGKQQVHNSWEMLQPLMRLNESGQQLRDYALKVNQKKFFSKLILDTL